MAVEIKVRVVDGHTYEIQQFATTRSLRCLRKLVAIFGESMAWGGNAIEALKADEDAKASELMVKAVKALIDRMDEDVVLGVIIELTGEAITCDHQRVVFDSHYAGRLDHLFKVLYAALEVQYGNFLNVATSAVGLKKVAPGLGPQQVQTPVSVA
jgi:hypothetical protein